MSICAVVAVCYTELAGQLLIARARHHGYTCSQWTYVDGFMMDIRVGVPTYHVDGSIVCLAGDMMPVSDALARLSE